DPALSAQAEQAIAAGASAAQGWREAITAVEQALAGLGDARMRERVADLRDVEQQVLLVLAGESAETQAVPENAVLLADELLPSQLLSLPRERLVGLATARGGTSSHVAIIAAAMGIPALVAVGPELLAIAAGTIVLLDAE